jgi:hypothetical protein
MTRKRISDNVTVALVVCNMLVLTFLLNKIFGTAHLLISPLLYFILGLSYNKIRPLAGIAATSYALILMVIIAGNWAAALEPALPVILSVLDDNMTQRRSLVLLSYVYLPVITLITGINYFSLAKELLGSSFGQRGMVRQLFASIVLVLYWRQVVIERYEAAMRTLEMRGANIPKRAAGFWLVRKWAPATIASIVVQALDHHAFLEQMRIRRGFLALQSQPIRFSKSQIFLSLNALIILAAIIL